MSKPLPEIDPCLSCGERAGLLLYPSPHVRCASIGCFFKGPIRKTPRGAINAWNKSIKEVA